ncbi:MAG: phosphoribosylaminoimidazolesuccinocarboxamide synthase [Alphaproteobacteria bacterium]
MKTDFLYEGKAKRLYNTEDPNIVLVEYKDDLTAFNAEKTGTAQGKGRLNNLISAALFQYLSQFDIPTHFVELVDDNHHKALKVTILPVEVIVRNLTAGSICRRLGVAEKMELNPPLVEFCYKSDEHGDPVIADEHVRAFNWATDEQIAFMRKTALKVDEHLTELCKKMGIYLVDFKIEFGVTPKGQIVLADEISPDTCRFWDLETMESLDKDRFRFDLGDVMKGYEEIFARIEKLK